VYYWPSYAINMNERTIAPWLLKQPKSIYRHLYDFAGAPLRLMLLPDQVSESIGLTSLRAERLSNVLPKMRGRALDVGAGDNLLINIYKQTAEADPQRSGSMKDSVGVDAHDSGSGCLLVPSSAALPFPDASFDTICFVACLNHIPERQEALHEARRLVRPDGQLLITMINRWIGAIGHALWWYSEEKHRHVHEHEVPGLDADEMRLLLEQARFKVVSKEQFVYRLNTLWIAQPV
jgi:SAM-dependent methyltransferase